MSKITIEGLTKRQRAIADVLWMINGRDEVLKFVSTLEPSTQQDAWVVINMMVAAIMDEVDTVDEAGQLLKEYML
jgi:hypothetical protein